MLTPLVFGGVDFCLHLFVSPPTQQNEGKLFGSLVRGILSFFLKPDLYNKILIINNIS